ncbi:MAG: hypothetical protein KKH51_03280 [Actinobacteria bacterium]|nr:hypothetical protein [Actinomycetota bacterium]
MTTDQLNRMVEAIASWQLELPGGRERLTSSAAELLTAGIDGRAVVEMASVYTHESRFRIDDLIDNLITELQLEDELSGGPDAPATHWMCRGVMAGEISERALSKWVHSRFHHQSNSELLNELALLDDRYDELPWTGGDTHELDLEIRRVAQQILAATGSHNDHPDANPRNP